MHSKFCRACCIQTQQLRVVLLGFQPLTDSVQHLLAILITLASKVCSISRPQDLKRHSEQALEHLEAQQRNKSRQRTPQSSQETTNNKAPMGLAPKSMLLMDRKVVQVDGSHIFLARSETQNAIFGSAL